MHKDFHNYFPNLFGVHKIKQADYQLLTQNRLRQMTQAIQHKLLVTRLLQYPLGCFAIAAGV